MSWTVERNPPVPPGIKFWQTVRINQNGMKIPRQRLDAAIAANPGATWVIGNEPDVEVQDNTTPDRYAEIYHELYYYIKGQDPTAKVAVGGVAQMTPLRRLYLDIMLDSYEAKYGEKLPTDVWTVHAYILREEKDSWGAGIPVGLSATQGELYELEDHANLDIWRQNLIDFRWWLHQRGYDVPLAITEWGILMPTEYGFPDELVIDFMYNTMGIMQAAAGETGYSGDGNRLVQWWIWYSLVDAYGLYNGNLLSDDQTSLTAIGQAWSAYLR